jgi:hypothetical protein
MPTWILLLFCLFLLISCGGGGGNDNGNPADTPSDNQEDSSEVSGVFIDSSVSGLEYICGTRSDITSKLGEFQCERDSDVTFKVGGVELGSTKFATLLSPVDLVEGGDTRNKTVQNIARFLQMLDYDGNPSNGIEISPAVRSIAANWSQINFRAELSIDDYISDAASVDNTTHDLPDGNTASNHLEQSLGLGEEVTSGCSSVYTGTPFCDDGTFPTCDTTNIPISSITSGMSYSEVIAVMGCHGVLTSVSDSSSVAIALYSWGDKNYYDWVITFFEQNGVAVVHSVTKS